MKFACENCGTRYTLSDEKVRNRLLKIRCKICENVIVISGQTALSDPAAPQPEPSTAEVEWFYARPSGETDGPMPEERLRDKVRRGELGADDLVWAETLTRWTPVGEVPAFAALMRRAPLVLPKAQPKAPGLPKPPALPPALAARGSRGMPTPLPPPGGGLLQPPLGPPRIKEADTTEAMTDLPAGLAGLAARLVDDGRETGTWQTASERETVSVQADPALLAASASLDTVMAPSLGAEEPTVVTEDFDTTLAPAVSSGGTDVLALLSPPPAPMPPVQVPVSEPPAPMVLVPSPRADAITGPAPKTYPPREASSTVEEAPKAGAARPGAPRDARPRAEKPSDSRADSKASDSKASDSRARADQPERTSGAHDAAFFGDARLALGDDEPVGAVVPAGPPRRSWLPLVLGGLVLLGGGLGLGLYFGRTPTPAVAPDATLAAVAPVDAARPPPPDAAPPSVVDAAPATQAPPPDAAVPDAAPVTEALVVQRPVRPRAPATEVPKAPVTEAASGALAALDRGRVEAPIEVAVDTTPLADLPDTLEQAAIVSVIKGHQRGVHGCYQRQLKRDPGMRQANVKLAFNIERSGQTSNVHIDEKYADTELASCLERLVRRWRFPAFKGEAIPVEYPLIFTASL